MVWTYCQVIGPIVGHSSTPSRSMACIDMSSLIALNSTLVRRNNLGAPCHTVTRALNFINFLQGSKLLDCDVPLGLNFCADADDFTLSDISATLGVSWQAPQVRSLVSCKRDCVLSSIPGER